jgi:hypothetical protein
VTTTAPARVRAARGARDARIGGGVDHRRRLAVGVELVHRERRIAPRGMGSASRSTTTLSRSPRHRKAADRERRDRIVGVADGDREHAVGLFGLDGAAEADLGHDVEVAVPRQVGRDHAALRVTEHVHAISRDRPRRRQRALHREVRRRLGAEVQLEVGGHVPRLVRRERGAGARDVGHELALAGRVAVLLHAHARIVEAVLSRHPIDDVDQSARRGVGTGRRCVLISSTDAVSAPGRNGAPRRAPCPDRRGGRRRSAASGRVRAGRTPRA